MRILVSDITTLKLRRCHPCEPEKMSDQLFRSVVQGWQRPRCGNPRQPEGSWNKLVER